MPAGLNGAIPALVATLRTHKANAAVVRAASHALRGLAGVSRFYTQIDANRPLFDDLLQTHSGVKDIENAITNILVAAVKSSEEFSPPTYARKTRARNQSRRPRRRAKARSRKH